MPSPEKAKALGIKTENFMRNTCQWLAGIAFGLLATGSKFFFSLMFERKTFCIVKTDNLSLMGSVIEFLEPYGVIVSEITESEYKTIIS